MRLPGYVDADYTTFTSSVELASALRRAAAVASTRSDSEQLLGHEQPEQLVQKTCERMNFRLAR